MMIMREDISYILLYFGDPDANVQRESHFDFGSV